MMRGLCEKGCIHREACEFFDGEDDGKVLECPTYQKEVKLKMGKWIEHLMSTECSKCHEHFEYLPSRDFCPKCGFPMNRKALNILKKRLKGG